MIEVNIDSIRVSLMSQHRVVVLKEIDADRYLPIWIGPFEADAITIELQGVQVARPLTHDLLKSIILKMGATVSHILVNDLRNDTFYARIVMDINGRQVDIDSRPSDAIALAVRVGAPIFVAESVMDTASIIPEEEVAQEGSTSSEDGLSVYREFLDSLDLDNLGSEED
jgi:bifunctional DNase/RNase